MKIRLIIIGLIISSVIINAQDTIFVKNGQVIPAVIIEKNDVEIKYKKPGQTESAAVYSVFINDIIRIRYSDGIIADYTEAGGKSGTKEKISAIDLAGTMKAIKISAGLSRDWFSRNTKDDLLAFWRYYADPAGTIGSNPASFPVNLKMTFTLGKSGRNWIGDELQLIFTPPDAINASAGGGIHGINLKSFYYNLIVFYGRTLNHRKTIAAIIETGLDIVSMSGYLKLNDKKYINNNLSLGTGFHIAMGADWMISKRLMATARAGYRTVRLQESHKDENSPTGYSAFLVPGTTDEKLFVKWNGPFVTIGLSYCMYVKFNL